MQRKTHAALTVSALTLVGLCGLFGWKTAKARQAARAPVFVSGAGTIDTSSPSNAANQERAMQQTQKLLDYLKAHNWPTDDLDLPAALLRLPDQSEAEISWNREAHQPSFGLFVSHTNLVNPEIAIVCDLYMRRNSTRYKGGRVAGQASGFFIVGYRDGRVAKVPVEAVRLIANPNKPNSMVKVYPGSRYYRADLPKLPEMDNSKANQAKEEEQYALAGKEAATFTKRLLMDYDPKHVDLKKFHSPPDAESSCTLPPPKKK